jgi:hypothetical protein
MKKGKFCRVVEKEDGTVQILYPNERLRGEGESDLEWHQRGADFMLTKLPHLAGRPFVDVLVTEVEKLSRREGTDDRTKWRIRSGKVVKEI